MEVLTSILRFFSRFHVEMWLCSSLLVFVCPRRKLFWLRYLLTTALYLSLPYLLPRLNGESLYYYSYLRIGDWVNFTWVLLYFLDMALLAFLFRFRLKDVVFYGSASYTMQHLMKRVIFLFDAAFSFRYATLAYYIVSFVVLVLALIAYSFFFIRRIKNGEEIKTNNILIISLSALTVLLFCFLSSYDDAHSSGNISLRITTCITDLLLLILLFGITEKSKEQKEKETMQKMLHEKEEDMILSKKNIELINLKAHDLKHQLDVLKNLSEPEKESHIDNIEQELDIYASIPKTKSNLVNLALTKKALYCQKHSIRLNYMVDDVDLSFFDEVDFYTMMGNILDNAIEALLKCPDKEKRVIFFSIRQEEGFLSLHETNYSIAPLVMKDNFPLTSKENKDYHGFGLRSIRYIAEKYGGNLKIETEGDMFVLNILFPLKEVTKPLTKTA